MNNESDSKFRKAVKALCSLPSEQWNSLNQGRLLDLGAAIAKRGVIQKLEMVNEAAIAGEISDESVNVRCGLSATDKVLKTECSCAGHSKYGCCEHAVALGLVLLQMGGRDDVLLDSPQDVKKELAEAFPKLPVMRLHVIEIRCTGKFDWLLFAPLSVPQTLLWKLGFNRAVVKPHEGYFQEVDPHWLSKSLKGILRMAIDLGVKIRYIDDCRAQSPILLTGNCESKELKHIALRKRGSQKLEFAVGLVNSNSEYILAAAYFDNKGFILENGKFGHASSRFTEELDCLSEYSCVARTGWWSSQRLQNPDKTEFTLHAFNEHASTTEDKPGLATILRSTLFGDGAGGLLSWSDLTEKDFTARLVVKIDRQNILTANLEVYLSGKKLDVSGTLRDFICKLRELRNKPASEVGRDGYAYLLAVAKATSLGNDTETQEIRDLCHAPKRKAIREWFEKLTCPSQEDAWIVRAVSSRKGDLWVRYRDPRRVLFLTLLNVWPMDTRNAVSHLTESLPLNEAELPAFFAKALPICQALGVELHWKNRRVRSAAATIQVDWKEAQTQGLLDPVVSVSADGTEIPEVDWDKLISGDLILEKRSRSVLIPSFNDQEALAFLQRQLAQASKDNRSKADTRLPESSSILELLIWARRLKGAAELKIPDHVRERIDLLRGVKGVPESELPEGFQGELKPYQKTGYNWIHFLYKAGLGACLADEMGLGKTVQAIAFLLSIRKSAQLVNQRSLVVAPASVQGHWMADFERFAPDLEIRQLHEVDVDQLESCTADVVLTTYDCVVRHRKKLRKNHFYVVVLDEAQYAKNAHTARRKALALLSRKFLLALTGTPLENSSENLVSILDLVIPGLRGFIGARADIGKYEETLQCIAQAFVLRRTKKEVMPSLPAKRIKDMKLTLSNTQVEVYNRYVMEAKETLELKRKGESGTIEIFAALTRLRQVCVDPRLVGVEDTGPSPKMQKALEVMVKALRSRSSVLLFSQFTHALDLLQNDLAEEGILPLRLDGSTPASERSSLVQTFQRSEEPKIFLISLRAGGVGLNLTKASDVILMDNWWNPATDAQAIDRVHRIGQSKEVRVWRYIMEGTIEEKILLLQADKQKLFDRVIEETARRKTFKGILSSEDFDFLLS